MADFLPILKKVIDIEKGYQNHPSDKAGNCLSSAYGCSKSVCIGTNYGIGAKTLQEYLKSCPTVEQMQSLAKSQAVAIYKTLFWDKMKGDYINDKYVAHNIFDTKVVQPGSFSYIIQTALAAMGVTISVSSTLSSGVVDAINRVDPKTLFYHINEQRKIKFTEAAEEQNRDSVPQSWIDRCSNDYGDAEYWSLTGLPTFRNASCEISEMSEEDEALLEDNNPDLMTNLKHVDKLKYGWFANNKYYILIPACLLFLGIGVYGFKKWW